MEEKGNSLWVNTLIQGFTAVTNPLERHASWEGKRRLIENESEVKIKQRNGMKLQGGEWDTNVSLRYAVGREQRPKQRAAQSQSHPELLT